MRIAVLAIFACLCAAASSALSAKAPPLANTIIEVSLDTAFGGKLDALKAFKGQELSSKTVAALLRVIQDNPRLKADYVVQREPGIGGTKVIATTPFGFSGPGESRPGKLIVLVRVLAADYCGEMEWTFKIQEKDGRETALPVEPKPGERSTADFYRELDKALLDAPATARLSLDVIAQQQEDNVQHVIIVH